MAYSEFGLIPSEIFPIVNHLRRHVYFVEEKSSIEIIKNDPTDNMFIECAFDGNANYIISGDHHLLNLEGYKLIKIISAKDFLIRQGLIRD